MKSFLELEKSDAAIVRLVTDPLSNKVKEFYKVTYKSSLSIKEDDEVVLYATYKDKQYSGVDLEQLLHELTLSEDEYEGLKDYNPLFKLENDFSFSLDNSFLSGTLYFKDEKDLEKLKFHLESKKHIVTINNIMPIVNEIEINEWHENGVLPYYINEDIKVSFIEFYTPKNYTGIYEDPTRGKFKTTCVNRCTKLVMKVKVTPLNGDVVIPYISVELKAKSSKVTGHMSPQNKVYLEEYPDKLYGEIISEEKIGYFVFDFDNDVELDVNLNTKMEFTVFDEDNNFRTFKYRGQ